MPSQVSAIIEELGLRFGWGPRLSRRLIWESWEEIVGPQVALHAWPERFRERDTLVVVVSDSVWMQHLSYQRQLFLESLNARLSSMAGIKDITFVLGNVAEVRSLWNMPKKEENVLPKADIRLPDSAVRAAEDMMEPIRDEELRQAMTRLYLKYLEKQ